MDSNQVIEALKKLKETSNKRKFKQTIDLIINLKDLDLKKPDHQLNLFVRRNHPRAKKVSVCGLVGPELSDQSKEVFDETIAVDDFVNYVKDKKITKQLANKHIYFVAQANIMPKVAGAFGKILGTRGKMPNPKAGCVVPPGANLKALYEKLQKTVKVVTKTALTVQCIVGGEDTPDEQVVDNIMTIYNSIIHHLPNEKNNIKNVIIKYTMGPTIAIGEKAEAAEGKEETKEKAKKEKKPDAAEKEEAKEAPKEEKDVKKEEGKAKEQEPKKTEEGAEQ